MGMMASETNMFLAMIISAVLLDFVLGDPHSWPHPVVWIGRMISAYEKALRRLMPGRLKLAGFVLAMACVASAAAAVTVLMQLCRAAGQWAFVAVGTYLLYTSLAAKCLKQEAMKVMHSLDGGDIDESRRLLSYLVGRETAQLDRDEITRAVVETVAENTIDGVLAPMFWIVAGAFAGYPVQAAIIYKTINTLDSMVGYVQEPYTEIGFASAKLDDAANLIPARLGSLIMVAAGGAAGFDLASGLRILARDRKNHKSPNCAYPEAAAAGLMNIRLGGTNTYFGQSVYKPTIGDMKRPIDPGDIEGACRIMYASQVAAAIIAALVLA